MTTRTEPDRIARERHYRDTVGMFATGVTVITVGEGDDVHGMTANAVMSVSLRPPLIAIAIDNRSYSNGLVRRVGHFAVNILAEGQEAVALRFARPQARGNELFEQAVTERTGQGDPLLPGRLAHLACTVSSATEAGDHTLFVAEVQEAARPRTHGDPLLFFRGRFGTTNCRLCIARLDPIIALQALHEG